MNDVSLPLQLLCDTAMLAAREAGQYIQSTDRNTLQRQLKDVGSSAASQLVTQVDIRSEAIIRQRLQSVSQQWDIAFVGEESSQSTADTASERLHKPYYWCVDPLDGTLPFVEGNPGYAVSIALVDQSGMPLIGVVYDPVGSTLMHAIKGQGAYRDQVPILPKNCVSTTLQVFADASFKTHELHDELLAALNDCARHFGLDDVTLVFGSGAVTNACQVLDHQSACYVKLPRAEEGGGSIWDFAATACIINEVGGWVSNIHGEPLDLNRQDSTFMNHQGVVYASNQKIARYLIAHEVLRSI